MVVMPAIDLRDGCCVQLVGGSFADERVRLPDPVAAAERWIDAGFRRLHVVDLDAALGVGTNAEAVARLARLPNVEIQVGGGIRSDDAIERLLDAGVPRVVVGTRAVKDFEWLARIAARWPGRIVVAADTRRGRVVTDGWTRSIDATLTDTLRSIDPLDIASILVTSVDQEGRMRGPDLELVATAARSTTRPIVASGGVGSLDDLRALARRGAAATVVGMAFYSGALDPRAVAEEFSS
jgi:phosphoribosylformimino-5-aminoimidazole carboxamide ribotide isomerase